MSLKPFQKVKLLLVVIAILFAWCYQRANTEPEITRHGLKPMTASIAQACSLEGDCIDGVLLLQGQFTIFSKEVLEDFFLENNLTFGDVEYICFDSPGGENSFGIYLGTEIANNKINTCVADAYYVAGELTSELSESNEATICASMCPFTYMSGNERIMLGKSTEFLYHSSQSTIGVCGFCVYTFTDKRSKDQIMNLLLSYKEKGSRPISEIEKLIDVTFSIPHEKIAPMTYEQLAKYNVVTQFESL
ncbi:hypothetical protein BCT01_00695 [Vibrio tasmaniensis]|nr:hypothetical protein BCT01_00695 [Vibrio tasmaniensis]PMP10033.1 hypothetical protein BCS92_02395 [Vibrio tasmaniensis]